MATLVTPVTGITNNAKTGFEQSAQAYKIESFNNAIAYAFDWVDCKADEIGVAMLLLKFKLNQLVVTVTSMDDDCNFTDTPITYRGDDNN